MYEERFGGCPIRQLRTVDHFTREYPAIVVGQRFPSCDVATALDQPGKIRSIPKTIRVDNEGKFTSKAMDRGSDENRVTLDFSRPGKPTDKALIKSFTGSVRAECLNENWFWYLEDAKVEIDSGEGLDYNAHRTNSVLGNLIS